MPERAPEEMNTGHRLFCRTYEGKDRLDASFRIEIADRDLKTEGFDGCDDLSVLLD